MEYRLPMAERPRLEQALSAEPDIHEFADAVFWSNPATADLRPSLVTSFHLLPPAFVNFLVLATLDSEVLNGGYEQFLDNRPLELRFVPTALRAAGMPQLAAACVLAGHERYAEVMGSTAIPRGVEVPGTRVVGTLPGAGPNSPEWVLIDVDFTRFFEAERAILENPAGIVRERANPRFSRIDELYYANEPANFHGSVLNYVRANLDDFVQPG